MGRSNRAILISIGDELLIGQTVNTNASWLSSQLDADGFRVIEAITASDNAPDIESALQRAEDRGDIIIVTGGLGPTADDITKPCICGYFSTELIEHQPTLERVNAFFASRGLALSPRNGAQALVPAAAEIMQNDLGTAPGLILKKLDKVFFFLPGVPFEMMGLYEHGIRPRICNAYQPERVRHATLMLHGIGESYLADKLKSFEDSLPSNIKLAYLPSPGIVKLRLSMRNYAGKMEEEGFESLLIELKELSGDAFFGFEGDSLEGVLGKLLTERGLRIAAAESCTGGLFSHLITSIAGASHYFMGSVIAYDNSIKTRVLGVDPMVIEEQGAVSEEVARQMAVGVRNFFNVDYGLASTGIAGPTGGSPGKPVGTVFLALAGPENCQVIRYRFGDHRERNIRRSALALLDMLRKELLPK